MLKSASHLTEAAHCRILAASISDFHERTVLTRMATVYEKLATRAARNERT